MKKLFTLVCAAVFSLGLMAVDLTQGASYRLDTITAASFAGLDSQNPYWSFNSNGYYGNTAQFVPSTASDILLNAAGDKLLDGLKVILNNTGKLRIYVGTKNNVVGLYFDSNNSKLIFPGLKADQVITITYANASDSEAGFTVTNADASQDVTNHIETLTVKADGDVTLTYNSNKFYLLTIDISAYVAPVTYTVTYKANGGTGEDVVDDEASKVAACTFTAPEGKSFDGWNTQADGEGTAYAVGAKVESNLTLFAQWVDLCVVTFNLQGHGDAIAAQSIEKGGKVVKPANPYSEDYVFEGWFKEASCENEWNFANDVVSTSTELFAKWRKACFETIYSLTAGVGSAEVTAADATVTETSLSMANTSGRIKLTPATGFQFKNGDIIMFAGTIGNTSKKYGVKVFTADGQTSAGEIFVAGTTDPLKAYGTITLASDQDNLLIGRYDGTTTTLTTCIIKREVECKPTAIDNNAVENVATKRIVNGQLIIEKNGEVYNVLGARVR